MSDKAKIYFTKPGEKLRCSACDAPRTIYLFSDSSAGAPPVEGAAEEFGNDGGTVKASWLCIVCAIGKWQGGFRDHLAHRDIELSADDAQYARSKGTK